MYSLHHSRMIDGEIEAGNTSGRRIWRDWLTTKNPVNSVLVFEVELEK